MKQIIIVIILVVSGVPLWGQLTIGQCYDLALANYPLIKQYGLIEQSMGYTVENVGKQWLPQATLNGRATYQSAVTRLPIDLSLFGVDYKGLPHDQYDVSVVVNQTIYDGGAIGASKDVARAGSAVEREQLNVSLYDIRQRVNGLYFGILLLDEQIKQYDLLKADLALGLKTVEGMVKGGVANQTDVDAVKVEIIKAEQMISNAKTQRGTYIEMLGAFTRSDLSGVTLVVPAATVELVGVENNRPELELLSAQDRLLSSRLKALDASIRPKVGAFVQGGVGNPGLNMLKNGWEPYVKVGATLTWNFGAYYTRKNDLLKIETERKEIANQRETFLFNNDLQQRQTLGAISNLRGLITQDDEIISLRERIRSKSELRVENGTLTVNEMLRDINAVSQARQQRALHETQLLQQIYELKTLKNN